LSPRRIASRRAGTFALLLSCLLLAAAAPAHAKPAPVDLETATVAQLQEQMRSGELTSVRLTKAYIDRIEALNRRGPGLNAVRMLNPAALGEARARDLARRRGNVRGPLHGIPVLVKDNLDAFGMPTTAGSVALERSYPRADSTVVAKLRAAGAVLLGKTNLTEFANFFADGMPTGYSSLGGQVLNAYDTDAMPGGSSSGSGTALGVGRGLPVRLSQRRAPVKS
jgi:amidase